MKWGDKQVPKNRFFSKLLKGNYPGMTSSLKLRILIPLVLILSTAIGGSSYVLLRMQYNQFREVTEEKLNDIAVTIHKSIKSFMIAGKLAEVRSIITAVGTLKDLETVRIFSTDGKIVMSSHSEEVGEEIDPDDLKLFHKQNFKTVLNEASLHQPVFYIIKPIVNEPACFRCHGGTPSQINGILQVNVSLKSVLARLAAAKKLMIFTALFTVFVLTWSIFALLTVLVNRPVGALLATIRRARDGDLEARVQAGSTREFSELGENFNTMLESLGKAREDLRLFHAEQLERADRMATIGEMAAGIAHEIKNPLAGIGGAIQVLMQSCDESDERREIFDEILVQIDRIDGDIKDLLSYARTGEPELGWHNINQLVNQSLALTRDHAAQQGVEILTNLDDDIPTMEFDDKQIQQVFVNLGLNAIQAMPDGGALTIETKFIQKEERQWGEIKIKDTGVGINASLVDKIFTPFFTTRTTGTGLGLSISHKIIKQHHGELFFVSQENRGTCFTIVLPLHQEQRTLSLKEGPDSGNET